MTTRATSAEALREEVAQRKRVEGALEAERGKTKQAKTVMNDIADE